MKTNNFFSIIIPTMWKSNTIIDIIKLYQNCKKIKEIIIIDNNPIEKKNIEGYSKLIYYTQGKNLFVNPSWNIGATLANYEIILSNDDILIENIDEVLDNIEISNFDIIGIDLSNQSVGNVFIKQIDYLNYSLPLGDQISGFGSFMYIKNYTYIPNTLKIWYGDDFLIKKNKTIGIITNAKLVYEKSVTVKYLKQNLSNITSILENDKKNYFTLPNLQDKKKIIFVLVNYGFEQIQFLAKVISNIKKFIKYNTHIVVHSNVKIELTNIDELVIFTLSDYQLLPLTCRKKIWQEKNNYDLFVYGENDHLFEEHHFDKFLEYYEIIPKDKITGLIQYEYNENGYHYPGYHANYDWDFDSVEVYNGLVFAHFKNLHQASFILNKEQLNKIGAKFNFENFFGDSHYSKKCKVNTDIYQFCDFKKLICISEFKENIIHHLPNLYIDGKLGRNKNQSSPHNKMKESILRLMDNSINKKINGFYLNLDKRQDRNEKMLMELKKTKHNIQRFSAIDGEKISRPTNFNGTIKNSENKQYATYLSHLNILKKAKENNYNHLIVLEDDITLCDDFDKRLNYVLNKLPKNWEIFYLSYNPTPNTKIENKNDFIFTIKEVYGCFGMLINGFFIDRLILLLENNLGIIDDVIKNLVQPLGNCYTMLPTMVYVNDDYSDIWNKNRTLTTIKSNFKAILWLNEITIIIPTYKNPTMLSECLNSIQNINNYEILVGIDGCEETLDYVKNNKFNENIKFFYFGTNVGPYVVKNSLSNIANSDILLFFDSDDIMKENMIPEIFEKMKTNEFVKPMYIEFTDTINPNINKSNKYGEGVFAIKKELFLSMNGFEPWPIAADSDFMSRLYKNNVKFEYTNNIVFYRRVHPNSLTQSNETGLRSALRGKYYTISKNKTNFKPLPQLTTSDFYEIFTEKEYKTNTDIPIIEIPKPKDLTPILKNEKTIDYDRINEILGKKNPEKPKPQPRIPNPPINRNEINQNKERAQLAKESIKRR